MKLAVKKNKGQGNSLVFRPGTLKLKSHCSVFHILTDTNIILRLINKVSRRLIWYKARDTGRAMSNRILWI